MKLANHLNISVRKMHIATDNNKLPLATTLEFTVQERKQTPTKNPNI